MRVSPDAQTFTALSRDLGARRRDSDAAVLARQSSINDAYTGKSAPVRRAPPVATPAPTEERPEHQSQEMAQNMNSQRREAPMGQRPKFVPKGQSINILV
jgi:hypothetical protein